jgi:hypothetical protein
MKKTIIIPAAVLLCSMSAVALAQSGGQAVPAPIGASVRPDVPAAMATPSTMPGGLYRLANGYLSCPDSLPITNGQPNLRSCTYVKDLH